MMRSKYDLNREVPGMMLQSLDVLDFGVVHLSWYERTQRRYKLPIRNQPDKDNLAAIMNSTHFLKEYALLRRQNSTTSPPVTAYLNRTVVIMPFLGSTVGDGNSKPENRFSYLHACFWGFYAEIPHIVAVVMNERDALFAR